MCHVSHLVRRFLVPLALLSALLVSPYHLAAQPGAPPFTLAQQLFALDDTGTEPAPIDELAPGLRSVIRTTVSNPGANPLFLRIE